MDLTQYQNFTKTTAIYPSDCSDFSLAYCGLGIADEAGEVAGAIKKLYRDDQGELSQERKLAIMKEVGDVLWYAARICDHIDVPLEDVFQMNINKLSSRKERGKLQGDGDNR